MTLRDLSTGVQLILLNIYNLLSEIQMGIYGHGVFIEVAIRLPLHLDIQLLVVRIIIGDDFLVVRAREIVAILEMPGSYV